MQQPEDLHRSSQAVRQGVEQLGSRIQVTFLELPLDPLTQLSERRTTLLAEILKRERLGSRCGDITQRLGRPFTVRVKCPQA